MRGVITGRDVMANLGVVWREFGSRCVLRCLLAWATGRRTTFLALAFTDARDARHEEQP
jgi:hypothetical protein